MFIFTMNRILILYLLLGTALVASAQETHMRKIRRKDSLALGTAWRSFVQAIDTRDTGRLRSMSFKTIDCISCFESGGYPENGDFLVPADTFIFHTFRNIFTSRLWKVIHHRPYFLLARSFPGYIQENVSLKKGEEFTIYEICYTTYKPDEWAPGHQGQTQIFQFVKVDRQFRFYGFVSVPGRKDYADGD